jgi:hypothetical protein
MSDISITAANVLPGAGAVTEDGLAGATITAGQVGYKRHRRHLQARRRNGASAAIRTPRGIALNGASAGQPLRIQKQGRDHDRRHADAGVPIICPARPAASARSRTTAPATIRATRHRQVDDRPADGIAYSGVSL